MITGIGHTAVTAKDMEESIRFYTQALGFREAFSFQHPETGAPWIVYLSVSPGQFMELFYGGTEEAWNKIDFRGNQFIFNGMTLTFLGKKSLEFVEVTGLSDATYTGEAITQSPVVEYDEITLTEDTDYTEWQV